MRHNRERDIVRIFSREQHGSHSLTKTLLRRLYSDFWSWNMVERRSTNKYRAGSVCAHARGEDSSPSSVTVPVNKESDCGSLDACSNIQGCVTGGMESHLRPVELAAMEAESSVNQNIRKEAPCSYESMSLDQKRKLLWGSKTPRAKQEPIDDIFTDGNSWGKAYFSDPHRQRKFLKLMGVKTVSAADNECEDDRDVEVFSEKGQRALHQELEKQFAAGLRRGNGQTTGLGL